MPEELYIKWEGWARNKALPLTSLGGVDEKGAPLDFRLEPYADGTPAPIYLESEADGEDMDGDSGDPGTPRGRVPGEDDEEEQELAEEEGEEDEGPPADVIAHGQHWKHAVPTGVQTDARAEKHSARSRPSFTSSHLKKSSIIELFMELLPKQWLEDMVQHTNHNLAGRTNLDKKTDKGEILRWWGYALALSLHPGQSLDRIWAVDDDPDEIMPPPRMGRFGMTKNRWRKLRSKMAFGPSDEGALAADEWAFVRPLVDAFNKHMADVLSPGWLLCIDESMCAWRGHQGKGDPDKIPFLSFVPRKPEPLGGEMKTTADALSGIMMYIEICEGKAKHGAQEFFSEYGHTTATTLRCTKPWHGSGRAVYGDSHFAGVKTAEAMLDAGLHFVGDVKTNTRRSCLEALDLATTEERGAWAVYTSELELKTEEKAPIFLVSHRRGPKVHKFISTFGTTLPGNTLKYEPADDEDARRSVDAYQIERKCPRILNDATLAQPAIDRHNRYRQNILALEKRILTDRFNLRFASSLFGMVYCNAFFALRHFSNGAADFRLEMTKLSLFLMRENPYLLSSAIPPSMPSPSSSVSGSKRSNSPASSCEFGQHRLVPVKSLRPAYKGTSQPKCNVCNRKCTWVCLDCSNGSMSLWPCHPPVTKYRGEVHRHSCLAYHRDNPDITPRGHWKSKRAKAAPVEAEEASACGSCDEDEEEDEEDSIDSIDPEEGEEESEE